MHLSRSVFHATLSALRSGALPAVLLGVLGCNTSSSMQTLTDTAYDVAMAERFGRIDLVTSHVVAAKRDDFADAHADWGGDIRIVDLEYGGIRQPDPKHADVTLTISWTRENDPDLRTTVVKQHWAHMDQWVITGETRARGDRGLVEDEEEKVESKSKRSSGGHNHEQAKARLESTSVPGDLISDVPNAPER